MDAGTEDPDRDPGEAGATGNPGSGVRTRARGRTWLPWLWVPGAGMALLALALVLPFFLVRSDGLRAWLLQQSLAGVFAENVRAEIGTVVRFQPGHILLRDVHLTERTPEGVRSFARIEEVHARWHPWDLTNGRITVRELVLRGPWVDVALLPERIGAESRPRPRPRRPDPSARALPDFACRELAIEGVAIDRAGTPWLRADFAFRDLAHEGGDLLMRLEEGRVRSLPDSLDLTLTRGVLAGTWNELLEVDSLRIESEAVEAGLAATLIAAPGGLTSVSLDGALHLGRFEPLRVAPLRRLDLPWAEGDVVEGTVLFGGELAPRAEPHADLVLTLAGRLFGTVVDTLRILADATPSRAELLDFRVRSGAQALAGEGIWEPKERRAEGRVAFSGLDLSARPVAAFVRDLPSSGLEGAIAGDIDSLGRNLRFQASLRLDAGQLAGRPLGAIHAAFVGGPDRVDLDTLWIGSEDEPQLRAHGWFERSPHRPLALRGELARLPIESWVEPWVGENLGGMASGSFTVGGTWDDPRLHAGLRLEAGTVVEITAETLEVTSVGGALRPFRLDAEFIARGLDFYGFTLDSLRATAVLAPDTLRTRAVGFRDSTAITLGARVVPRDPGVAFLDDLEVVPGSAPLVRLAAPARLGFSASRVWMDSVRVESESGEARGSAWILPRPGAAGTEPFAFEIEAADLDLAAFAAYYGLDADTLSGRGALRFAGSGTVGAPGYVIDFHAESAEIYGWLCEAIDLSARAGALGSGEAVRRHLYDTRGAETGAPALAQPSPAARGLLLVDSLSARVQGYSGRLPTLGSGQFGPEPPGPPIEVEAREVFLLSPRTWADWVAALVGDSAFVTLEEADLGGRLEVRNAPLAPFLAPTLAPRIPAGTRAVLPSETIDPMLAKIRSVRPGDPEDELGPSGFAGRVDLDLDLAGRGGEPELRLDALARRVQVFQARADSVTVRAAFVDSLLYLRDARWAQDEQRILASGRVPLALSVDPEHVGWTARPLWIEVEIPAVDLALASLFTSLVEDPRGDLTGRLRLKGVPPSIYLEGDLRVEDGSFRIPLREERLSAVHGDLRLDSLGVHIESAEGRWNETGKARLRGWYRDEERFSLDGSVEGATVFESGNYHFLADGIFHAEPVEVDGVVRPRLSGEVEVAEGALTLDLAKPGRQKVLVTPWLIDLNVTAPSNVRVIQPTSSVDLVGGELQVRYDMPYWNLGGKFDIARGQYLVFNKSLEIVEGRIDFLDSGTGPYPVLDVKAETQIADPQGENTILVVIDVDGSPLPGEALTVSVESPSHPEYSQEDLIDLLTIGQLRSSAFATGSAADPARGFLTGQVLNQLERELIREAPWLDVVDVRGGTDPNDPIVISFRAITEPQWTVRYSQELSAHPGREVSLNYRISNLFFLNASADQREDEVGTSAETYSLDFRLRYEF